MSDIKLFRIVGTTAKECPGSASDLEKPLQSLIEANLDAILGIRFLATEYRTGKTHAGRIDTLGLDENKSPVILDELRRARTQRRTETHILNHKGHDGHKGPSFFFCAVGGANLRTRAVRVTNVQICRATQRCFCHGCDTDEHGFFALSVFNPCLSVA
jgi:hypothetical protein